MASRGGCGGSRYDPLGLGRGRLWRDADRRRGARAGELARDGDGRTRGRGSAAMKAKHQRLVLVLLALVAVLGASGLALSALKDQAAFFYAPGDGKRDGLPRGKIGRASCRERVSQYV